MNLGQLGKITFLTNKAHSSLQKVNDLAFSVGKHTTARLKHVDPLIMEREAKILTKLADGAIGTARVVGKTVGNMRTLFRSKTTSLEFAFVGDIGQYTMTSPYLVEDTMKEWLSKFDGLNIEGSREYEVVIEVPSR